LKDNVRESRLFKSRVIFASAMVLVLATVLALRLGQLQVVEYSHFKTLSHDNRVKIVPVAPTRGLIFDRNGVVVAQNIPTFSLEVVPEAISDMDALLEGLREIIEISPEDETRFRTVLGTKSRFESVPVRTRLDEEEVARFAVNRHRFPGVDVQAYLSRDYPLGSLGVHALGYVGRINEAELQRVDTSNYRATRYIGKTGVEQSYEDSLHGTVGYQHVETNAQGRVIRVLGQQASVPGSNLYLSIDFSLQAAAEAALGDDNGAVVAIEPASGSVLAFASMPGFDPNLFVNGIDQKTYKELLNSPERPLFNRALHGQYPPGSTVKPFVGLAGLETGTEQADKSIFCPGFYRLEGRKHKYRDWKKWGHGNVELNKAIVESCDVFFYALAHAMGIQRMHDFLVGFGLGRQTGIDLIGESRGLMPSPEWKREDRALPWYPGETLIAGIGQGFTLATPLQLAFATATLGMRGLRLQPQVVQFLEDPQSRETWALSTPSANPFEQVDVEHWERVIAAMADVVHGPRGTARRIGAGVSYRMAGKTGTAQVFGIGQDEEYDAEKIDKKLQDHALFIAFAPVDEPRIAVAVLVENGGSGSKAAAPIARKVLDHYLLGNDRSGDEFLMTSRFGTKRFELGRSDTHDHSH
jgi:penicillin-binding protein 2